MRVDGLALKSKLIDTSSLGYGLAYVGLLGDTLLYEFHGI